MNKSVKNFKNAQKALQTGHYLRAISYADEILLTQPNNIECLMIRGEANLRSENYEAGVVDYAKVVEIDNKNITALVNFSVGLIRCDRQQDAKNILEYVLELDPEKFDAYINLCNIYQSMGKPEECLKLAFKAIEIRPGDSIGYNNLGTAFGDLNMISESREALLTAYQINPKYIPTAINLAQIEVKLGNHHEAISLYENLLKNDNLSPSERDLVKYYLGYAYLHTGKLDEGWDLYDFGYGSLLPNAAQRSKRKFNQPKWNGENIEGKTLLIWREQGLGDEIEFSTCLHDLSKAGIKVILECESRLVDIFSRTFPSFRVRAESIGPDFFPVKIDFDVQCAIGSLPRIYRRSIQSFSNVNTNLSILESSVETFSNRLAAHKHKKLVGICWRSGVFSIARNLNYTALLDWKELLCQSDFQFVNLQYGDCEAELIQIEAELGISILRWTDLDLKNDLENVLGLIKNLDAVVTVGTAVSSLAGVCNVPTYLLTQPNWMLLGQTDDYPWYACVTPLIAQKGQHLAEQMLHIPELIRKL